MKSQADIIYNHIEKQKRDNVEKVEINKDENIDNIINQYNYKTNNNIFKKAIQREEAIKEAEINSIILMPYFLKEVSKREKELGLNMRLWSVNECVKFENYFMNKYKGLMI